MDKIIAKLTGKQNFKLSKNLPISYVIRKGYLYLLGLLRGFIKGVGIKKHGKHLYIGRKTKLINQKNIHIANNVRIENFVIIDALSKRGVTLGNRVKFGDGTRILCSGSLTDLGEGLTVGDDSSFSENTFFGAAGGISIGNDVIAGQNVRFHAENHNYHNKEIPIRLQGVNRKGIKIGNNVWIGAGAVFLDGAEVGDGCVVGAEALVTGKFEENSILVGIPAKIVSKR